MEKVNACPCGSGIDFKECHGSSNIIQINPDKYDVQLSQLNFDMTIFSAVNFDSEINIGFGSYEDELLGERPHLYDKFISGVIPWFLLNKPIINDKTAFERYYISKYRDITSTRVKKIFTSWKDAPSSFYHITSIDDEMMVIEDVRTNQRYPISHKYITLEEKPDFSEGKILVATLIPFFRNYQLLISSIQLSYNIEEIAEMVSNVSDQQLKEDFPRIVYEALVLNERPAQINWDDNAYREVAVLLEEQMIKKDMDPKLVEAGLRIWKVFTDFKYPMVKKPNGYAAAVDYVVQKLFLARNQQTQKDLAKDYQSTVGTISKHSLDITDTFESYLWIEDLSLESFLALLNEGIYFR